jgi:hypothetical protein
MMRKMKSERNRRIEQKLGGTVIKQPVDVLKLRGYWATPFPSWERAY